VESGETCDGNCPVNCNDGNTCTEDLLVGSAQKCDATCSNTPIRACKGGDGCCPAGCSAANDSDCNQNCVSPMVSCPQGCCSWQFETVYTWAYLSWESSLVLDSQDNPLIAFDQYNWSDYLYFATKASGSWVRHGVRSADGKIYKSLVLGKDDTPYILFADTGAKKLKLAIRGSASTTIETLPSKAANPSLCSIAIDSKGQLHVAYMDGDPNWDLRYIRETGSSWVDETVYATGHTGQWPNVVLDSNDQPHIIFQDPDLTVRYARKSGSSWTVQQVMSKGSLSGTRHTAIDSQNRVHFVAIDSTLNDRRLRYGVWNGSYFTTSMVDTVNQCIDASLALDSKGAPHIAYTDLFSSDLLYARRQGNEWERIRVNVNGQSSSPCIAIDSLDQPHISYYDHDDDGMHYAHW
jgi:hypothetical protein